MIKEARPAAALLAFLLTAPPAAATASLTCDADDRSVSLHVGAAIGHAGDFSAVEAKVAVKSRGAGAKPVELSAEQLVQRWATGRDVRLRFFRDEPAYSLDLTIETRGREDDEKERPGTYRLEFIESAPGRPTTRITRTGRASCTVG